MWTKCIWIANLLASYIVLWLQLRWTRLTCRSPMKSASWSLKVSWHTLIRYHPLKVFLSEGGCNLTVSIFFIPTKVWTLKLNWVQNHQRNLNQHPELRLLDIQLANQDREKNAQNAQSYNGFHMRINWLKLKLLTWGKHPDFVTRDQMRHLVMHYSTMSNKYRKLARTMVPWLRQCIQYESSYVTSVKVSKFWSSNDAHLKMNQRYQRWILTCLKLRMRTAGRWCDHWTLVML